MTPDKSLQNLFSAALERSDAAERARFLDEACGADAALRERVEKLLRAQEEVGAFMAQPSRKPAGLDLNQAGREVIPLTEKPGDKIGRYKLLQQIGEGGCGVVYMAEQEEPVRRRVALKVIKLGMDTKQVIARFEAERQALALMDHPNIAKVLDAGATETGRPFFVMELVRGVKITEFCDQKQLSTNERLELFIAVCQAVQHAHQKGIIHRDLKPSNILVTTVDGLSVPKVIDFGIAKATNNQPLTDRTLFTAFEQFIGTPAYMSPEQAEMSGVDIDTRTDIYSLGVLLYELLTGSPPFDQKELLAAGLDGMRRIIREAEPPRPSNRLSTMAAAVLTTTAHDRHTEPPRLVYLVRGDLDWIAMKCLEKDRARRYETATALSADIRRHLDCEPVVARPPSRWYEFQKTVRRHKFGFAAAGAVILALAIGLGVSMWQFAQKNRAFLRISEAEREQSRLREIAEAKEKQSQQVAQFLKDMLEGVGPSVALGRDTSMLREILDKTADRLGEGLTDQPAVEAELRTTIGEVYYAIGEYEKAEAMHREALAIRTSLWKDEHLEVAQSLNALAMAVWKGGNPTQAEDLLRRSLEIRTGLLGDDHSDVAHCLCDLGDVLRYAGKVDEAIASYRRSLKMRRMLYGNENLEVADSLNRLGSMLSAARDDDDEALLRESLAIRRKLLGNDHPGVAEALDNLAHALHRRNNLTEAEPMHREALAMRRKYFGSNHSEVALSLLNVGQVAKMQGRLTEAEAAYREAWDMRSTLRGYDLWERAFRELLDLMQTQGRLEEGEALCRQALAMAKDHFGEAHREVELTLTRLARVLEQQGKLAEAEAVWRESLAVERRLSGDEHPWVANSLLNVAGVLIKADRPGEAELLCREALAIRRKSDGNEHHSTRVVMTWLGQVLQSQGKHAEAGALFREQLDQARAADGKGWASTNSGLGVLLHHFAEALWNQKAFKEARPPAEEALELFEQHPDWPDKERLHAYQVLSAVLTSLNDQRALESLQRNALARLRGKLPANDPRLADALATMTLSLLAQQKFTEAEAPAREALTIRAEASPDDWRTFNSRSQLGGSLLGQKKYAEAETLLLAGCEGMKQREATIPPAGKVRIRETLQRLVQLYEATGQPEKAAEWNKKLAEFDQAAATK